jgi:hypothetical protein
MGMPITLEMFESEAPEASYSPTTSSKLSASDLALRSPLHPPVSPMPKSKHEATPNRKFLTSNPLFKVEM